MKDVGKWVLVVAVIAIVLYIDYKVAVSDLPDWIKYLILR